jgi:hypothetical protein
MCFCSPVFPQWRLFGSSWNLNADRRAQTTPHFLVDISRCTTAGPHHFFLARGNLGFANWQVCNPFNYGHAQYEGMDGDESGEENKRNHCNL